MGYDVTIGIPVYKSVDYIRRSLESAIAQTYPSIEYLIIDDAGGDGSMEIVETITQTHSRGRDIRIIQHADNLGVSASRNQIIDEAHGEFLFFMDSDDTIADNTIELLMQNARCYNAEIVFGSYEKIDISGNRTNYQYPELQLLKEDELAKFAYRKYAGIQASVCNYLVKTSILRDNNHRFIDANYWEDMAFTFDLVTFISRAVLLPNVTYSYLCHENSLSNYQERQVLSKSEIVQNIHVIEHLKETSSLLYNKEYFPNRCLNIVLTDFFIACNVIKRRNDICPNMSNLEIKRIIKHPASFIRICKFRHVRLENMALYILGHLPSNLCVTLIGIVGRIKKLI